MTRTDPDGSRGLDDHIVRDFTHNIGAEIMDRNKFGPVRGPWPDEDRFHHESVPSPSGVVHHFFWRR